jgi:hypothetical protein
MRCRTPPLCDPSRAHSQKSQAKRSKSGATTRTPLKKPATRIAVIEAQSSNFGLFIEAMPA